MANAFDGLNDFLRTGGGGPFFDGEFFVACSGGGGGAADVPPLMLFFLGETLGGGPFCFFLGGFGSFGLAAAAAAVAAAEGVSCDGACTIAVRSNLAAASTPEAYGVAVVGAGVGAGVSAVVTAAPAASPSPWFCSCACESHAALTPSPTTFPDGR